MRRVEEEDVFTMSFTDVLTCVLVSSIFLFLIFVALVRTESASSLIDGSRAPVESNDARGREAIALGQGGRTPIIVRLIGAAPLDERGWIATDDVFLKKLKVDPVSAAGARHGSELFIPGGKNQIVSYRLLPAAVRTRPYTASLAVWIGGYCFEASLEVPDEATFYRDARQHAIGESVELFTVRLQGDFPIQTDYGASESGGSCR